MSGQSVLETVVVLAVAFVGLVLIPLGLLFTFVKHRGGPVELYRLAAEVKANTVAELLPWGPGALAALSREWVGTHNFTASMFGRNQQASGRVPSCTEAEGWLLAFHLNTRKNGAHGVLRAVSAAHRLELNVNEGQCRVSLNGAPLGSFRVGEPAFFGPDGAPLGTFGRQAPEARLVLREREVCTIDTRGSGAGARVASPRPLINGLRPERTPEDEAWALVFAVYQLAWVGLGVG